MKLIGALTEQQTKQKITDWALRIFTINDKNPLYLPVILTVQFFEDHSGQGVSQLVIKLFEYPKNPEQ